MYYTIIVLYNFNNNDRISCIQYLMFAEFDHIHNVFIKLFYNCALCSIAKLNWGSHLISERI